MLSECRTRLVDGAAEHLLVETLVRHVRERSLLRAGGRQHTDSTPVLAAVRSLNRLERVGETRRHARTRLAVIAPDWLRGGAPAAW